MARVYLLYALCNILTIFITLKWLHERKRIVTKEIIRYRYRNQLLNQPFSGSDEELRLKFQLLINKSVDALDEELVELARQVIEPPSERRTKARTVPVTPQIKDVIEILGKKRHGFFVECGAYDGESASNTFYLEKRLGWSGLLIESDYLVYTKLRAISRHSYTINACLGPTTHPEMIEISSSAIGGGKLVYNGTYGEKDKRFGDRLGDMVPCFPLDTLLAAMDRRHVDYLSLDVEGYELDILRSISWDKFIIDVISVEYVMLKEGKKALKDYMETIGYVTFDDINYSDEDFESSIAVYQQYNEEEKFSGSSDISRSMSSA
ncbi:hypothetical protein LSH36_344g03039 [Paralvinella palmiformis]|uniref:Methyltransferase FkbM domain-containing protein n=1 Tax=Paralvinella palmiformis TaxID=53620 RepID=A0AAD9JFD3_9ANNE|nr:hypothetical protein LSH36_344g03039 [Paralvinella palmiformis]